MSILIKGMKMPNGCKDCVLVKRGNVYDICPLLRVPVDDDEEFGGSPINCPLIELPDHGDLIDRDETAHEMWMKECYECSRVYDNNGCKGCAVTRMINVIACAETAPSVIPAERSEE